MFRGAATEVLGIEAGSLLFAGQGAFDVNEERSGATPGEEVESARNAGTRGAWAWAYLSLQTMRALSKS